MCKISITLLIIIIFFWINMWHSEIIQTALKCCITTKDFNTNDNINNSMLVHHQLKSISFPKSLNDYVPIPSYWASSQALAHFGLEMIFFNSINKPSKKTLIDISEPVIWHVYWSAVFGATAVTNISMWMSAITTMHWRSSTIALEAYYI